VLRRYGAAVGRLDELIDPAGGPPRGGLAAVRARAEARLDRLRRFLRAIGDPHLAAPVVHVAGTSGKGSTAATIAAILGEAGYRVGLHTSPYLQVATEKLQLDGALIDVAAFADLVDRTLADAERWRRANGESRLSYGEIWVALAARAFAEAAVDLAVVEVGAGGRFDLTNVVEPAVAVVTTIGLDHQATLGPTLAEIAWHKAGIIKPGVPVVTGVADPVSFAPIRAEAELAGAEITRVVDGVSFTVAAPQPDGGAVWRERALGDEQEEAYAAALPGRFQAANGALALAAVRALSASGFRVTADQVRRGIAAARLPGRMERMPGGGRSAVLLDGAHNPQKIAALLDAIGELPGWADRPVVLLGLLEAKDRQEIVRPVADRAAALVFAETPVRGKAPAPPAALADAARAAGFAGPIKTAASVADALAAAEALAAELGSGVIVTGSLFLVGRVRERWFPSAAILRQRTPWPTVSGEG